MPPSTSDVLLVGTLTEWLGFMIDGDNNKYGDRDNKLGFNHITWEVALSVAVYSASADV